MGVHVKLIKNHPVDSNCFLIYDKSINNRCLVVDPGSKDPAPIEQALLSLELIPEAILLTHEHFDHTWSCNYLHNKYGTKAYASQLGIKNIRSSKQNCSRYYDPPGFEVDIPIQSVESIDNRLSWNGIEIDFFATAGHSDASICFTTEEYLFTGDTLIYGLRTVTNILSGSKLKLADTMSKLERLKDRGYTVCPGHGDIFELDKYDLTLMTQ